MAALFPNPPIKTIPTTPFIHGGTIVCGFYAPVFYAGARWGVGFILGSPNQPPSVIKSTDGGTSWAKVNQSGAPNALNANALNFESFFTVDGVWHVLAPDAGGNHMAYAEFDMNTETWGAAITSGTITVVGGFMKMAQRLSGDVLVVYEAQGATRQLSYSLISGGVWGAKVDITTVPTVTVPGQNNPVGILVDALDTAHILYEKFIPYESTLARGAGCIECAKFSCAGQYGF